MALERALWQYPATTYDVNDRRQHYGSLFLHCQFQPCTRQLVSMVPNNFKVLEGLEKTEFMIDSALLARQSSELDQLANRYLVENKERCDYWQNIDVETFVHFSKFTYTGAYYGPEAKRRSDTLVSSIKTDQCR